MSFSLDPMSDEEGEEGNALSLTEMLMAELEGGESKAPAGSRMMSPPRQQPSKRPKTPPSPDDKWESLNMLITSRERAQDLEANEECSMMEALEGMQFQGGNHSQKDAEVRFENGGNKPWGVDSPGPWKQSVPASSARPSFPSAAPGKHLPPRAPVPMPVPPPSANPISVPPLNVPPPSITSMVPPPMSMPPPNYSIPPPMAPMAPPPPIIGPMSGPPFAPLGFGYNSYNSYNRHRPPVPIIVDSIPDTTLAHVVKGIKKKKVKSNPKENVPSLVFGAKSENSPEETPNSNKTDGSKHIKEHKLIIKNETKNVLKETTSNSTPKNEDRLPAKKNSPSDPITSVRLAESDALPELYNKLKKLNAELFNLKDDRSHSSSESDSEHESPFKKPRKKETADDRKSPIKPSTLEKVKPAEKVKFKIETPNLCKTNLDTRIKAMLSGDPPKVMTTDPHVPKPSDSKDKESALPSNTKADNKAAATQNAKAKSVGKDPTNVSEKNKSHKPLLRPPSPYLSRDIYYYWHKETIKFSKIRVRDSLPFVDPTVHYRFRDNRVAGSEQYDDKKTLPSTQQKQLLEPEKPKVSLKPKQTEEVVKETPMESKEEVEKELEEDYKRLEEINRQLKLLEEEEGEIVEEDEKMDTEEGTKVEKEESEEDMEEDDDETAALKRLAEIRKQLEQLEDSDDTKDSFSDEKTGEEKDTNDETKVQGNEAQIKAIKRKLDPDLIKMVMESVMSEIKHDLKKNIVESMVDNTFEECHSQYKRQKIGA